jgi:uncharacterized protein (TIGR03435 family)
VKLKALSLGMALIVAPLLAQPAGIRTTPRFEVASIKEAAVPDELAERILSFAGGCGLTQLNVAGSRVFIDAATTCSLVRLAYDVADHQVVGVPPELTKRDRANIFQVEARAETGAAPSLAEARLMLQTLLAERFLLRVRREPREIPVYALVVARGGPKFTPCANPDAPSQYVAGHLRNCTPVMPWSRVTQMLAREAGRPVLDETELPDASFEVHWLPDGAPPQPDSPPSLFTAIQEQLGLRLEPQRSLVDSIVVDHAERPRPN